MPFPPRGHLLQPALHLDTGEEIEMTLSKREQAALILAGEYCPDCGGYTGRVYQHGSAAYEKFNTCKRCMPQFSFDYLSPTSNKVIVTYLGGKPAEGPP